MINECFHFVQGNIVKNLKSHFKEFRRHKKGTSGGNSVEDVPATISKPKQCSSAGVIVNLPTPKILEANFVCLCVIL